MPPVWDLLTYWGPEPVLRQSFAAAGADRGGRRTNPAGAILRNNGSGTGRANRSGLRHDPGPARPSTPLIAPGAAGNYRFKVRRRFPDGETDDPDAGRRGGLRRRHRGRQDAAGPGGDQEELVFPAAAGGRHDDRGQAGAVAGVAQRHRDGRGRPRRHGERRPVRASSTRSTSSRARPCVRATCSSSSTRGRSARSWRPPRRSST